METTKHNKVEISESFDPMVRVVGAISSMPMGEPEVVLLQRGNVRLLKCSNIAALPEITPMLQRPFCDNSGQVLVGTDYGWANLDWSDDAQVLRQNEHGTHWRVWVTCQTCNKRWERISPGATFQELAGFLRCAEYRCAKCYAKLTMNVDALHNTIEILKACGNTGLTGREGE